MCLEVKSIATQTHFTRLSQRLKSMFFKRFYFFTLNLPISKRHGLSSKITFSKFSAQCARFNFVKVNLENIFCFQKLYFSLTLGSI